MGWLRSLTWPAVVSLHEWQWGRKIDWLIRLQILIVSNTVTDPFFSFQHSFFSVFPCCTPCTFHPPTFLQTLVTTTRPFWLRDRYLALWTPGLVTAHTNSAAESLCSSSQLHQHLHLRVAWPTETCGDWALGGLGQWMHRSVSRKAMAGALLLALSLILLGWGAEGQGNEGRKVCYVKSLEWKVHCEIACKCVCIHCCRYRSMYPLCHNMQFLSRHWICRSMDSPSYI